MLSDFSPCESGGFGSPLELLDISQEEQEQGANSFLVNLTPEKPPTAVLSEQFQVPSLPNALSPTSNSHKLDNSNMKLHPAPLQVLAAPQAAGLLAQLSLLCQAAEPVGVHEVAQEVDEVAQEVGESFLGECEGDTSGSQASSEGGRGSILTPQNRPQLTGGKKRLSAIKENLEPKAQSRSLFGRPGQKMSVGGKNRLNPLVKPHLIAATGDGKKASVAAKKTVPSDLKKPNLNATSDRKPATPGLLRPGPRNSSTPSLAGRVTPSVGPKVTPAGERGRSRPLSVDRGSARLASANRPSSATRPASSTRPSSTTRPSNVTRPASATRPSSQSTPVTSGNRAGSSTPPTASHSTRYDRTPPRLFLG